MGLAYVPISWLSLGKGFHTLGPLAKLIRGDPGVSLTCFNLCAIFGQDDNPACTSNIYVLNPSREGLLNLTDRPRGNVKKG